MRNQLSSVAAKFARFNQVLGSLCGYVLLAMNLIVFYAVIMRYLFSMPPTWSTETSVFILMFIIFIPLGLVTQNNAHITVDFVILRLRKGTVYWLEIINCALGAGFSAILLWQTCILVLRAFQREWVTIEMGTPLGYPLLIMPLGSLVLLISLVFRAIGLILDKKANERSEKS